MVLYEFPLNESVRTFLRLDQLQHRLGILMAREAPVDHHFAIATLFEMGDVAARTDLRADLLKELERQRQLLGSWRGNPAISEQALEQVIERIDIAYADYNQTVGKPGQALAANEWLASLRSRIGIPGGTCEFDLPAYHAWQQLDGERRRADLREWSAPMAPLARAVSLALKLLRDAGVAHKVVAINGNYQQSLPPGRSFQLLRVRLPADVVPEISGHRLLISVRLLQPDDGRLRPISGDSSFELALCG